jgi:hypothetical protein
MAATLLQRERSIEVLPGSSSAALELSYALFEERTRSEKGYLPSDLARSPILKTPRFGSNSLSESSSLKSKDTYVAADTSAVKKQPETVAYAQLSLDKIMSDNKETSSTSSSEKENIKAPKKNRKAKKKGIMRFLRPKAVQGRKLPKKSNKAKTSKVQKKSERNIVPSRTQVGFTLDDEPSVETKRKMEEAAILEKAKEYTLKSTALLEPLKKGDRGNEDVAASIKQAKLAYEYAIKARKLYDSVGSQNGKPLCDSSVASSHVTEKAGNVTSQITKSLLSDLPNDDQEADILHPSLLVDLTGNVAPNVAGESSPGSIEIEHGGKILFEAPYNSPPPASHDLHSNSAGIQDMTEIAYSLRPNQEVGMYTEAQANTRGRSLSPLASILRNVSTKAEGPCLSTNTYSPEQPNKGEAENCQLGDITEVKRVKSEIFYPPALHPSRSSVRAKSTDEVQMSSSEIPIRSFLSQDTESMFLDDTPSPSQKFLIRHQKCEDQRRPMPKPFLGINCANGFECSVAADQDIDEVTSTHVKRDRIQTAVTNGDGSSRQNLWQRARSSPQAVRRWTREEYDALQSLLKEATELIDDIINGEVNVIAEVNPFVCAIDSSHFDDDHTYETRTVESSSLPERDHSLQKQEFDNGDDNTYDTYSQGSGSLLSDEPGSLRKQNFDDDTYETHSEDSNSLPEGPEFIDDEEKTLQTCETYETHSADSIADTASLELAESAETTQHEGFEVFEKTEWTTTFENDWNAQFASNWKETFDNSDWKEAIERADEYSTESDSFDALPREMKVVGTASSTDSSDEESGSESDESSVSSISNASGRSGG